MVKVRLGHRYKNRGGGIATIVKRLNKTDSEYLSGFRYLDDHRRAYKPNGLWGFDTELYPHDLVTDLGLHLQLRKTYVTDGKHKELIVGTVPESHPFYKDQFRFISESGRYYRDDGSRCRDRVDDLGNLIEEYQR